MFTMSAIDPALLILVNIYADLNDDRQSTKVYNNGVMQVSVFVSVNYNGEASEEDIIAYVQENVVIYSLNYGENVKWEKSTKDNGFHHDIDHAYNKNESPPPKIISDVRAPLYFTVPGGIAEGEHRWIAKLNGKQTNDDTPLTVTVERFDVSNGDVVIEERKDVNVPCHKMLVLKYKKDVFPDAQKLVKLLKYKGIKFTGKGGNSWVSMSMSSKGNKLGAFVEYGVTSNIKIADEGRYSHNKMEIHDLEENGKDIIIFCDCIQHSLDFTSKAIEEAWNAGILMVQVRDWSVQLQQYTHNYWRDMDYLLNPFLVEDNFGSRMEVKINWDKGDWYGDWAVESVTVVYP
uniref:Uncharacterized protein n=1 Tax=Amphimedon queenslandica TaxID=400682 RepID=A0A1X7T3K3_AMPQE